MMEFIVKSILVQALFLLCYLLFFKKDKRFIFNRFYLIIGVLTSLSISFISLPAAVQTHISDSTQIEVLVSGLKSSYPSDTSTIQAITPTNKAGINPLLYFFIAGCLFMIVRFFRNLLHIRRLIANSDFFYKYGFHFMKVKEAIEPFSFFNRIFIPESYLEDSNNFDTDVIKHEIIHVRHCHSWDALMMELILLVLWFNPLLWLYRKELKTNHEFCADHFATLSQEDLTTYCQKLINCFDVSQDKTGLVLGNKFSYSLIKNRIEMLHKSKITNFRFWRNVSIASLIIISGLFSMSFKDMQSANESLNDENQFIVLIDAGHGGEDPGAIVQNKGISEKDLLLELVKELRNKKSEKVKMVFTRTDDQSISLKERVDLIQVHQADLFLSVHINSKADNSPTGIVVNYAPDKPADVKAVQRQYADVLINEFSGFFPVEVDQSLEGLKPANFYVLKNASCPSLMLSLGSIDNRKERATLMSKKSRKQIAQKILTVLEEISNS